MTVEELQKALKLGVPMVIALDGPSGAGKSTLASLLESTYDVLVFHTDDYFLPAKRKTKERLREAGGNLDRERMIQEVFSHLDDPYISSHHYNCHIEALEIRSPKMRQPIILIEGVYSMHPDFQQYYDVMIYIEVDRETQHNRILQRSNKTILERFKTEWIPLEDHYFTTFSIVEAADIVLQSTENLRDFFT
ncbi:(d)CMP kinase [Candidatus Xianfuyuplasma coldseepsis]|uniref:Uridine kinase n=1 Tax=Candidatus Xianfuyuplasma coldseepsis TaxID=2782163 RepID=A0A7L7KQB1_9MOLU|nr:(d)CMP kinase [Xianfuyuplasma coldseepsis]QMS84775.1 uridine kinase [Xianfuyuplasma coldseepsis]